MNRSTSQFPNCSISQLPSHGQSLIELVIGMALGVILITATVNIIAVNLRNSLETRTVQTAAALLQEYRDALQAIGDSNWLTMYCPPAGTCPGDQKGGASQFYLTKTGTMYGIMGGTTSTIIEGRTFTRYFSIENINREDCGVGSITASAAIPCPLFEQGSGAIAEDPSTQKIVMTVGWTGGRSAQMTQYLTRNKNRILHQTDWSNGSGQVSFPTSTQGTIVNNGYNSANTVTVSPMGLLTIASGYASGTLASSIFDTRVAKGASLSDILWQGSENGGLVKFQILSSNCANGASNPECTIIASLVGTYNTPDYALGVSISGNYAYVADYVSGLQIVDISNPAAPTLTGAYNTPGFAHGVSISGNYAYVADGTSGLQIVDISNPAAPTLTGAYDTPDYARGVSISGNYAYVADSASGIQIVDISNPAAPTLTGAYNTPDSAQGVSISGNYAYVADSASGIQIVDISNPAAPTLTGAYDTPGYANGVSISGNYAYVADGTSGLEIITASLEELQYQGPDGTANTFYEAGPNIPMKINPAYHTNHRYIGYFVRLEKAGGPPDPQVNDIIINWSP